jgi:fructan beta-fructosidase
MTGGSGGSGAGGTSSAGGSSVGGGSGAGGGGIDGGPVDAGSDAGPLWGPGANYPYVLTNYDEPYRGQVHFTAPMGWLNDVNGVWYWNGVYHLGYQAYPYALDQGPKHWGHATSTDLVHWTHWPVMLDPTLVPGDVWSGSTVVDVNNTSGFKTGANPVLVSMYTATSRGTCLAYSNDLGLTWQAYSGNPVAIGGPNADTRDPHVFWHEPTQKWVTAHFDGGAAATAFYTSSDLKNWTRTSRIAFGFECPDIYELPIDGVATNTKWVLQDGSGSYLLGQFDGATFVPDSTVPKRMDMSPGFYAAQTFFRPTLPDARLLQMGWIRALDTTASGSPSFGTTAPFNQAITFPVEIKLVTFPDGVRVARTPVAEIQNLYGSPVHFDAQVAASGVNPFAALSSKVFDLEATIDLAQTTATTITFRAGNLTFPLAVSTRQLFGATVSPINNRVKIRLLRD